MWMKVDDRLHSHRKTRAVTKTHIGKSRDIAPMGLWVAAGSWSAQNGTDGWVPEDELDRWDDEWKSLAQRLVEAGLWWAEDRDSEPGFGFHDWHDYNFPTEAASASGTFGNHVRWHEKRAIVDPECEHCPKEPEDDSIAPESGGDIGSPSGGDIGGRIAKPIGGDRSTQPDPIPSHTHPVPEATAKPSKRSTKKPETKLAPDWKPTTEHLERALASGLVVGREVDKFRAHAEEHDRRAVNWNAAFTRWLINAEGYAERDRPAAPVRNLPHASNLELPPDGLSTEEYAEWERQSRARRMAGGGS